ncbi:MAG: hypothetical protein ABIJ40_16410 [Bacteroidota bacterium]|nr:hypothetical protein [Candidatus Margulisiibacteriota bacterium]
MSSWERDKTTDRVYRFIDNNKWISWKVKNEYQRHRCPCCKEYIYSKFTQIHKIDINDQYGYEYHINHKESLEELYKLRISGDKNNPDIFEIVENNIPILITKDLPFAYFEGNL